MNPDTLTSKPGLLTACTQLLYALNCSPQLRRPACDLTGTTLRKLCQMGKNPFYIHHMDNSQERVYQNLICWKQAPQNVGGYWKKIIWKKPKLSKMINSLQHNFSDSSLLCWLTCGALRICNDAKLI